MEVRYLTACSGRRRALAAEFGRWACFLEPKPMLRRTFLSILIFSLLVLAPRQSVTLAQTAETKTARFGAGQIVVSAGYKTERVIGPDFDVDYVLPEGAQLNKTDVTLGIYTGSFPAYHPPKKGVKTKSGKFGDRRLKWQIWKTTAGNKTVYHYETLIRLKGGQWVWHIFMAAPDPQHIQELMEIFKSYRPL
jgi:hypothetical protein